MRGLRGWLAVALFFLEGSAIGFRGSLDLTYAAGVVGGMLLIFDSRREPTLALNGFLHPLALDGLRRRSLTGATGKGRLSF